MKKRAGLVMGLIVIILLWAIAVQAEFGTGWTGVFYNTTDFTGDEIATVSNINGLNFNWPEKPTVSGTTVSGNLSKVKANNFSARFTSSQTFQAATYRFDIAVDDNIRVFIDNEQVFEDFTGGPVKVLSFNHDMTAGSHTLRVDFVEISQTAVLQFQWFQQGAAGVPTSIYTAVPSATPIPPLTASVSGGIRGLAVRTGPYLGATMVTVATPGTEYPVMARNPSEDGVTWYQINVDGKIGWSSGRYLVFNTDPGGLGVAGSVFDTLGNPPETGVIAAPRSIMHLRAQPSTRTAILGLVPWGAEMPLLNRTVQGGKDRWYQVNYEGKIGWIFAPFVSVHGDIRDVPIR